MTLPLVQLMVLFNKSATLIVKKGVVSLYPLIVFIPLNFRVLLSVQSLYQQPRISLHMFVLPAKVMAHSVIN